MKTLIMTEQKALFLEERIFENFNITDKELKSSPELNSVGFKIFVGIV